MLCRNSPVRAGSSATYGARGFTLLDLLIVIMIIGILGVIVIPQFHSMITESKLNEAAGELVSGLQYAGSLAIQYQRPFGLKAEVTGNWFKVFDTSPYPDTVPPARPSNVPPVNEDAIVLNPLDKKWYIKDFDDMGSYQGVHITSVPAGGEIRFYPDGHSSSSDNTFVLSLAGDQKTITVNGTTGRISVQ
ncbi:MAG: GspH/FimT family pseudopilin [Desulfobacteraceae bacterium]|nr:GspH/FimT family pseudopilin [Desulfobacteraceae bacterium]